MYNHLRFKLSITKPNKPIIEFKKKLKNKMKKKEDYITNFDSKKLISFHFKLALKPQKREKKIWKKHSWNVVKIHCIHQIRESKKTWTNLKLKQKNLRIFEMNVRTGSLKAFRYICCMYTISILYCVWIFCELCAALNQNRTVHFANPFTFEKSH